MTKRIVGIAGLLALTLTFGAGILHAADGIDVDGGADFVNRYVWRGLEFGDAPAIQPSLSANYKGLEIGFWGSYATGKGDTTATGKSFAELDAYISYTYQIPNSIALTGIVTDYYFPNNGIRLGSFNDYDDEDGAGAHVIELGLGITGPETFPLSFYGFVNVYNDEGNNMYFQANYPVKVASTSLDFFIGAAAGSEDTPEYYGTEDFAVTNIGVTASKDLTISSSFSLPVFMTYQINPKQEQAWLLFGFGL